MSRGLLGLFAWAALNAALGITSPQAHAAANTQYCDQFCSQFVNLSTAQPLNLAATCGAASAPSYCQYNNGQVQSQCLSYAADKGATTPESVVLGLDVASTAACGAACALEATGIGSAMVAACQALGTAAGTAELIQAFTMKSSALGKTINAITAAGAVGMQGLSIAGNVSSGNGVLGNGASGARRDACVSAALFAVLTGLRYHDISSQNNNRDNACNTIMSLASGATTADGTAAFAGSSAPAGAAGSGNNASGGSMSPTTASGSPANYQSSLTCVQASGLGPCVTPQMSAATDGGVLTGSGLDTKTAALAQKIPADSGQGLGQLMSAGMSGTGAGDLGDIGKQLTDLAQQANSNAAQLASSEVKGAVMAGGDSGGDGAKSGTLEFPKFGSLESGGAEAGAPEMAFQKLRRPTLLDGSDDIFHSKYKGTIFDIVSARLNQSRDRVIPLEWASPLNRALAGMPAHSKGAVSRSGYRRDLQ